MTILRVLQYPDPRLRTVAKPVTNFSDPAIQKIIDDMFETHYAQRNCAALAATQLDIADPPRITVIDFSPKKDEPLCLINGVIESASGELYEPEGCMSVGIESGIFFAKVKRAKKIRVKAFDRHGKPLDFTAEDFMAKCIQHEFDHLDGKIFLDHLSTMRRQQLVLKLQKAQKKSKAH